ncbi:hypothetical protein Tco_0856352 [Tanacetum coccineum]|uniref:Gag-pol polyprotein n=1 Tax=Tanacetum coccineum TaxID=301880 RepID=A0ABQ5B3K1_9ASTR
MSTLAEFIIVAGAENRPPMLDEPQYESWKSCMKLYIQGKDHGRIILKSVENGPIVWPTIALENGIATNIVLQGLPADVYALVNHYKVGKDIWDRVKMLMQGTSLSKQKRECKLYDKFDKFSYIKGETLHQYYLRFAQLINDMNIIQMTMQPDQVNTKFLNRSECTHPKRRRDATWFKENVLLVQAQAEGKELDEEKLAFLTDPRVADDKAVLLANLSSCDSYVLSKVPYSDTSQNDTMNQSVHEF